MVSFTIETISVKERIHSALEYLTYAEFEVAYVDIAQNATVN
jgi:hypothetical protein